MTAPDRIWLQHPEDWNETSEPDWFEESEGVTWCWEPINQDDVEYIRKGAFPVEEIRGFVEKWSAGYSASDLGRDHSPTCPAMLTTVGQCSCERGLMRRILSLLEDGSAEN